MSEPTPPTLDEIRAARTRLGDAVRHTPSWAWRDADLAARLAPGTEVWLKLELFQYAGSFKPRGALLHAWSLDATTRDRGLVAVSAGNHAMAVAFAAAAVGTSAKVVMPKTADPYRVRRAGELGGEVILVDDVHQAFAEVDRIVADEGRAFVHPFEGPTPALGTATVALELMTDVPDLDAVVIPIGGGGLCAGMAACIKAIAPSCAVYGVEPEGADSMHRSFAAGSPQSIPRVDTIADSLGAPHAAPYSFALCQRFVDDLVRVRDDDLCRAMGWLQSSMKLAVEPAGAAATAALLGPLASRLAGKRVGLVVCGANIDVSALHRYIVRGRETAD